MITNSSVLSVELQKKKLCENVKRDLIAQMIVMFHSEFMRQYDFDFIDIEDYSRFTQTKTFFSKSKTSIIRMFLIFNDLILNNMKQFRTSLKIIFFDYVAFYSDHSTQHFFQLSDYFNAIDRSHVHVSTTSMLSF
jgi:hypothetical protein